MLEVINVFILSYITHVIDCYIVGKIEKIEWRIDKKSSLLIAIFSLLDCFANQFYGIEMRMIFVNLNTLMLLKITYNKPIIRMMIYWILTTILYAMSEMVVTLGITEIFSIENEKLVEIPYIYISNILIFTIYYQILRREKVQIGFCYLMDWYKENKKTEFFFMSILGVANILCIMYPLSMIELRKEEEIILILFLISSIVFVSGFFKQKSDNNELQTKYEAMNDYCKTYEKLLAKKSREEHEHKNQLIIIREKVYKKNEKLMRYIDGLLEQKEQQENYDYIKKLKNIPEGGLKGLIYYKIEKILEEKMEVYVNVSKKLSKKSLWNGSEKDLRDISMSLGVYLDNAIEAARESKKKYIVIEIDYEEEEIEFEISNTYGNQIGEKGKSSKGMGRGQGLLLASQLIEKNPRLREEKEMSGGYYIQKLYYHIK